MRGSSTASRTVARNRGGAKAVTASHGGHLATPAKRGLVVITSVLVMGIGAASVVTHGHAMAIATAMVAQSHASAAGKQTAVATPGTSLHNGQTVMVHATGFAAHESLVTIECADKGSATGMGDCDLSNVIFVTSSATGTVDTTYTVSAGPFGSNHIVCGAQPCTIQVSQPTPTTAESGTANISFGMVTPAARSASPTPSRVASPASTPTAGPAGGVLGTGTMTPVTGAQILLPLAALLFLVGAVLVALARRRVRVVTTGSPVLDRLLREDAQLRRR